MRRALALLMLCAFAAPALAGRTLVVNRGRGVSNCAAIAGSNAALESQITTRRAALYRTFGMQAEVYRMEDLKTEWLRQLVTPGPGGVGTRTYVAGIVNDFTSSGGANETPCPCNPCSLSLLARRPVGPWIFHGATSHWGTGQLQQLDASAFATCSTGFQSNGAPTAPRMQRNMYVAGEQYFARGTGFAGEYRRKADPPTNGVFRPLVWEGTNDWYTWVSLGLPPPDLNVMVATATAANETTAVAALYGRNGVGPPVIIASGGQNSYTFDNWFNEMTALALADSAALGQMLFQTYEGPVRFNIQVGPYGASGHANAVSSGGLDEGIGPHAGAAGQDSSTQKGSLSSFQTNLMKGTVLIQTNADSVAVYATQLEWVRTRWPLAHVTFFEKAGVWTAAQGGSGGANTLTKPQDIFGVTRTRSLFPEGETDPRDGCDCSTDTLSVYCGIMRRWEFLTNYFGAQRVDHVITAPLEDWTPQQYTRTNPQIDSLKWCFWLAKVKAIRVGNYANTNDVGSAGTSAIRGWKSALTVEPVLDPATKKVVGRMVFMPSRDWDYDPNSAVEGHDLANEFLNGLFNTDWYYGSRNAQYVNNHNFFMRTVVFEVPANSLGSDADGLFWRRGYWDVLALWGVTKAANRFGRTILEPSYGEETARWLITSGLR